MNGRAFLRGGLLVLIASLLTGAARPPGYTVTLSPRGDGDWTAEYRFSHAAPAWLLPRTHPDSAGRSWRPLSWTVETPGVSLQRRGRYDVLVGGGAPLRTVRLRVRPFSGDLNADYTPALRFSDGGLAHYLGHYELIALDRPNRADKLGPDLVAGPGLDDVPGTVRVRSTGRVLLNAKVAPREALVPIGGAARPVGYAYVGEVEPVQTAALAAVIDPGLPLWLREELSSFTPRLLQFYAERLGPPRDGRPSVFVAWGGGERVGSSLGGSVSPGLIAMEFAGARLMQRSPVAERRARWFLAHEAAHFWLGQTVRYARRDQAWITEGGANMLAIRSVERIAPESGLGPELLAGYVDSCADSMAGGVSLRAGSLKGADDGPQYTCGALLWLAAEGALAKRRPGADATTFARMLIDAERADEEVSEDDWLRLFGSVSGNPALTARVRSFVVSGAPDPRAFLRELFAATGVRTPGSALAGVEGRSDAPSAGAQSSAP